MKGHYADHLTDLNMDDARDREIWRYAKEHSLVIVTKDQDFFTLSTLERDGPQVVWIRKGNTRRVDLLAGFEAMLPTLVGHLCAGEKLIEFV